jgi:hypothetical protein
MASQAIEAQGTIIAIGQGDATTTLPGVDVFDTIGETQTWDGPSGSASVIDVSHLGSIRREKRMGLPDEGQFTFTMNRIFGDAGQASAKQARSDRELRTFKVTYSDGSIDAFTGYVLEFPTSGGVDQVVTGSMTVEISGAVDTTEAP